MQRHLHEHRCCFWRQFSKHWKIYMHPWISVLKCCQGKKGLEKRWKTNKLEHAWGKNWKLLTHLPDDKMNNESISTLIWWLRPSRAPFPRCELRWARRGIMRSPHAVFRVTFIRKETRLPIIIHPIYINKMFIAINLKSSNFHPKNLEKTDIRKITVLWQFYEIKLAIKENYSVKRQGGGRWQQRKPG